MEMTRKKAKLTTEETPAAPNEVPNPRFLAANVSAIWLNVFDKLDPQDKLTLSRADSEWHDLVDSKRTQFFYPEVAPILTKIFSRKETLQSRELCKLWSLEWDRQIVTNPSNLSLDFETVASEMQNIPNYRNDFYSAAEIQQFLKDMENHPGNPFPGRNIRLHWSVASTKEDEGFLQREYGNSVVLLLEKFGKHVHSSTIVLTEMYTNGLDNKALLRNALLHLPNLRKLEIYDFDFEENENSWQVDEYYRQNPLPLLENLETLVFHGVGISMVKSLLNSCCFAPAIKRLYLDSVSEYHLGQFDAVYNFRNLEVLSAPLFFQDLERLNSQGEFPPLRELDLKWRETPSFQLLLKALEPFGNSLVSLQTDRISVWSERQVEINLPNLRRLLVGFYEGSLDPLLQLTSLTHIGIYDSRNPGQHRQKIKFYGLEQQMEKSNIWGLMPSLKTFKVRSKMFYCGDAESQVEDQSEGSN